MRREVTPEVVADAERLLSAGMDHPTIAARLGLTDYVVRVIAGDSERPTGPPRSRRRRRRPVPNSQRGLEAMTVRRVQRMLEVGILTHLDIAREAGVSVNMITNVASGRRPAVTRMRPPLEDGERFLREPMRCSGCHAMISVAPCRACRAERERVCLAEE